ncbi:MAG: hypothetical protein IPI76_13265 [Chloracidobacterium sp.]|nr:hypothetical protein [Chloracidobacterium sp.]
MPVVHRDIKPQNLKVTPHGQVVLLDFDRLREIRPTPGTTRRRKAFWLFAKLCVARTDTGNRDRSAK